MLVNCVLIHFEKMHVNCSSSKGIGDDMFVYQIFLNSEMITSCVLIYFYIHVVYCHYDISTHEPCFVFEPLIVPHVTGKLLKTVSSRFFFSFVFKYITRKHATFL